LIFDGLAHSLECQKLAVNFDAPLTHAASPSLRVLKPTNIRSFLFVLFRLGPLPLKAISQALVFQRH